jgi:type IV pilus assembly protein PilE
MRRSRGFTLTELMITVAVVAILVAIGYPTYQGQLRKGARAAAQSAMLQIADKQAQYLLDARNYAVGPTALADLSVSLMPDVTTRYTVTIKNSANGDVATTPPTYTVIATPVTNSGQEPDGVLTLTHTGAKTRAGNPGW